MTRAISLLIMLLVASPVGLALDPVVSKATAAELVRDALASLGEDGGGSKIAIGDWPFYWAPDFITLYAEVLHSSSVGPLEMRYFAVNPWSGDVWEPFGCTRITSPTLKRKQDEIWKSSKLPDEARQVLQARAPACTPGKPEPREKKK
jgi:hypothetical protein